MELKTEDWTIICQNVTNIILPMFRVPFPPRVKSSMLSALFEIEAAKYYNSINIPTRNAQSDFEPDITFLRDNTTLEIKVTKESKSNRFRGNKLSKNDSHYLLIVWDFEMVNSLFEEETKETMTFDIVHAFIEQRQWDKDCSNYNASFITKEFLNETTQLIKNTFVRE